MTWLSREVAARMRVVLLVSSALLFGSSISFALGDKEVGYGLVIAGVVVLIILGEALFEEWLTSRWINRQSRDT